MTQLLGKFNWRDYYIEGTPRIKEVEKEFNNLLKDECPELFQKLNQSFLLLDFNKLIVKDYIMSIFTLNVPLHITKSIIDLIILE